MRFDRKDLEEYLQPVHSESHGEYESMELALLTDSLPVGPWPAQVCCARAASAPGPNGLPYHVYKRVADVFKYLWKLMMWNWAAGILILKEKNDVTIGQF